MINDYFELTKIRLTKKEFKQEFGEDSEYISDIWKEMCENHLSGFKR